MGAIEAVCKDRGTALLILETFKKNIKAGTQRDAIEAVIEWIQTAAVDDSVFKLTHEEREALMLEIETELRDCMSDEERKAKAAFYYGIPTDRDFNIVILPPGSDCMLKEKEGEL
jgi:hypothetical protein